SFWLGGSSSRRLSRRTHLEVRCGGPACRFPVKLRAEAEYARNVDDNKHDDHDDHNAYECSDGADSADGGFRFSHGFDGRENGPVVPACQAYLPLLRTILERQACRLRQIMVPVSTARRFFCFPTPETDAATRRPYHLGLFES